MPAARWAKAWVVGLASVSALACVSPEAPLAPTPEQGRADTVAVAEGAGNPTEQAVASFPGGASRVLFDGADLTDWQIGVFTGFDEFELVPNGVVLPQTAALAGMTYRGEAPTAPYDLSVEATKRWGADFFLAVTFPVRGEHLTLVLGGWGGAVTGLSCIDGEDASTNATSTLRKYPNSQRFSVLVRVTDDVVQATIDGESIVDFALEGAALSLRPEVLASRPLGLASFATSTIVHRVSVKEARAPGATDSQ